MYSQTWAFHSLLELCCQSTCLQLCLLDDSWTYALAWFTVLPLVPSLGAPHQTPWMDPEPHSPPPLVCSCWWNQLPSALFCPVCLAVMGLCAGKSTVYVVVALGLSCLVDWSSLVPSWHTRQRQILGILHQLGWVHVRSNTKLAVFFHKYLHISIQCIGPSCNLHCKNQDISWSFAVHNDT